MCERTDALTLEAETLVVACGARSGDVAAARGVELPVRPLVRQLVDVGPVDGLPADLPMTIEETGFHFRRVGGDGMRLAMPEQELRWDAWDLPIDGLELINPDTSWRLRVFDGPQRSRWLVFRSLMAYQFRAPETMARLLTPSHSSVHS